MSAMAATLEPDCHNSAAAATGTIAQYSDNGDLTSDATSEPRLIIIRHSERIDEVDKPSWKAIIKKQRGREAYEEVAQGRHSDYSIECDPKITARGQEYAMRAAVKLKEIGSSYKCVFSSRLRRCIETAYQIAKELSIPIYVSIGLAQTALAVEEAVGYCGQPFEFLSMEAIRAMFPDVEVYCCDQGFDRDGNPLPTDSPSGALSLAASTTTPALASADHPQIPVGPWLAAIRAVSHTRTSGDSSVPPIIVAHRETVRNLAQTRKTPSYCSLSVFKCQNVADKKRGGFKETYTLEHMHHVV